MGFVELVFLALGLAMDAFAVSVCKGLAIRQSGGEMPVARNGAGDARVSGVRAAVTAGIWFGGFQALMPTLGYLLGSRFLALIERFDHWIAFGLLALIGINMIREGLSAEEKEETPDLAPAVMLALAVATSIDALAAGISLAVMAVQIAAAAAVIGGITFVIAAAGIRVGQFFGSRYRRPAEFAGGLILIAIGVRILVMHLLG